MKQLFKLGLLAFILVLSSCGPSNEKAITLNLSLEAEGPFFAGPNSLMAAYQPDLPSLLAADNAEVKNLSLKTITVTLKEDSPFNWSDFTSASLQVVGDNFSMTSLAILNPIIADGNKITLTSSDEAELNDLFLEEFTLILDLDFVNDSYEESVQANVEMNLLFEY